MGSFAGLELLATAVVALDERFVVRYANPAAESLLATGAKSLLGQPFLSLFREREVLEASLREARSTHWDYAAQNVTYARPGREPLPLSCTLTRIDHPLAPLLADPTVVYLDHHADYAGRDDFFSDPHHLNMAGRTAFSRKLAIELRERGILSGPAP